jgi:2-polyprenyl-3-methyl-5-hydroxy-6-metoxy-1,4-benzoquinol methylase
MNSSLGATRYETPLGNRFGRNFIFVELAAQGKRILEFGCANGFISRHLRERGCSVTGVENDHAAAEEARQWCEKVVVTDLNKQEWVEQVGRDFNTVLFGDVLEHLVHPEHALRMAAKVLAPDGRIIICLPNIAHWRVRASLLRGRFEYEPTGILDATHLRFFTIGSARKFIEDAGYRVVSTHFFVGGGNITRPLRLLFPRLFALQMMFVAQPAGR